ncbi:MAG TPA: ABC transporter substrate-binding protein [Trueperaceae bacterium]
MNDRRTLASWRALLAALAALAGMWLAAGASAQESRPDIRVRLQFARPGGVYDPAYWRYTSDSFVNRSIFNSLVRMVPGTGGGELAPDLAESWEVSEDGTVYTFHLRQGVQFHGGYGEMTADDVVFTFQRQLDDPESSWYSLLTGITSVEAVDDYTVRITLSEPQPSFLRNVIAYRPGLIVSRAAVEERGEAFAQQPIGTGPYSFVELNENDEVVLAANDEYYMGPPDFASVTFVHVGEETVVAAALESGELDAAYTRGNPEVAQQLLNSDTIEAVTVVEYYNLMQVQFGPGYEPVQDVRVRQALAHAIDKSLITSFLPGLDQPADVMRPSQVAGGTDDVPTYPFDPERARQLLTEAGYPNGFDMTLMFQMREPETTIAQILAESWQAIGVNVTLEGLDATTAFDRRESGDFDVTFSATSRFGDPDLFFTDVFHSESIPPNGSNFFHYDGADELIEQARGELDEERREQLYHELQAKLMEELPIIPILYRAYVAAWREPVANLTPDTTIEFWAETLEAAQ